MAIATYRFFPWVRSGLAAGLPATGPSSARAKASVKVSITPELAGVALDEIARTREIDILGPGDVVGIDTRFIVRTDPRPGSRGVESNYLASIEFDRPDFPWIMTPQSAGPKHRLRPWLVLVVLDHDRVGDPKVAQGRPLPYIDLAEGVAKEELPNLAESWAWAHAQRLATGETDDAAALASAPERNVSRMLCPRRLAPDRKWLACLVPAYDVGVAAGIGVAPEDPEAPPSDAWTFGDETPLTLPLYFHWTFETGPDGDFEKLARRLKPQKISAKEIPPEVARRARAYLGAADGGSTLAAALPVGGPESGLAIDAPLDAFDRETRTSADLPGAIVGAIAVAANPPDSASPLMVLGPPLNGARHASRLDAKTDQVGSHWFDELNLDPRTRVAARVGADGIRAFQEELMQAAWEQVGEVIAANAQLARSRFTALVAERLFERHLEVLPPERLLAVASPLLSRLELGGGTARARIMSTSLPDRSFDTATRRMTSAGSRLSRTVVRLAPASGAAAPFERLAESLQKSAEIVDPSERKRDGVERFGLAEAALAREGPDALLPLPDGSAIRADQLSGVVEPLGEALTPRNDLAKGIFAGRINAELLEAAASSGEPLETIRRKLRDAVGRASDGATLVIRRSASQVEIDPVVHDTASGLVVLVKPGGNETLFTLEDDERPDAARLGSLVSRIKADARLGPELSVQLQEVDGKKMVSVARLDISATANHGFGNVFERRRNQLKLKHKKANFVAEARVEANPLFVSLPAPLRGQEAATKLLGAFETAFGARPAAQEPTLVRADLGPGPDGLGKRLARTLAAGRNFRARAQAMVKVPGWLPQRADSLDPILAGPDFEAALARLLATSAPDAFLPDDLVLNLESIAALRTNNRWIAAAMVGANHEISRELQWRTYPSDGRATAMRRFWDWLDPERDDIVPIHTWPAQGVLADQLEGNDEGNVVIAVRGTLLQRYPNTLIFAWKAAGERAFAPIPDDPARRREVLREAQFRQFAGPDLSLAGFDLTPTEFRQGWFLVLQEPISESRFGLDETTGAAVISRNMSGINDLNWAAIGVERGSHLPVARLDPADSLSSADLANRLLQRPVRVAIHSDQLVAAL